MGVNVEALTDVEHRIYRQGWADAIGETFKLFHDAGLYGEYGLFDILKRSEFHSWAKKRLDKLFIDQCGGLGQQG